MNKILAALPIAGMAILALAGCGHKAHASAEASALAHPTSSAVRYDEAQARAAVRQCFPQTVTGVLHLLSTKPAGTAGYTVGQANRDKVYACLSVPSGAKRVALDNEVKADLLQVHSKATLTYEVGTIIPAQVVKARA